MPRYDWREGEQLRGRDDFRDADYSTDFRYAPDTAPGFSGDRSFMPGGPRDYGDAYDGRGAFGGAARDDLPRRRRGPSDRVLWAVIVERLEHERRLDLRDVEVVLLDGEVTLNGTVRHKADKRRIEDVADIDGVRHVQNNLRVRERSWF